MDYVRQSESFNVFLEKFMMKILYVTRKALQAKLLADIERNCCCEGTYFGVIRVVRRILLEVVKSKRPDSSEICCCHVGMVHVDYTAKGGPLRLESLFPEKAEELKQTPFAVVQVAFSCLKWQW